MLQKQKIKVLESKQWDVNPKGCYLDLYQDDFESTRIWRDICEVIGTSPNQNHVVLLVFGTKKGD